MTKNLETCIAIDGKYQKCGKRLRFAVDDNIEHTNRIERIDESQLNSIKLSEVETIENIKFQSKLLCSNRCSDSYLNHMGYPSKLRHCSFNRLNTNEYQQNIFECNVKKEYLFSKNIKYIPLKKENDVKIVGELSKATLSHDHLVHKNCLKNIKAKNNKYSEVTNIINSIAQNNNDSNNTHTIRTYDSNIILPTNFGCNDLGSTTIEDTHNTNLLNITMFKSNLNRVVRQYQTKQKETKADKLG